MKTTKRMATVTIMRKEPETFVGRVLAETDTHVKVQHGTNPETGEWFARDSRMVTCVVSGN